MRLRTLLSTTIISSNFAFTRWCFLRRMLWTLPFRRVIFPRPVTPSRPYAPLWVFCFGISVACHLGLVLGWSLRLCALAAQRTEDHVQEPAFHGRGFFDL